MALPWAGNAEVQRRPYACGSLPYRVVRQMHLRGHKPTSPPWRRQARARCALRSPRVFPASGRVSNRLIAAAVAAETAAVAAVPLEKFAGMEQKSRLRTRATVAVMLAAA